MRNQSAHFPCSESSKSNVFGEVQLIRERAHAKPRTWRGGLSWDETLATWRKKDQILFLSKKTSIYIELFISS